jgi:Flp pilus assembly protein TadD
MKHRLFNRPRLVSALLAAAILCCSAVGALAQAAPAETPTATPAPAASVPAPAKGIEPVFPAENPNLVFVEAEDAVSTNFAREPVLNFGVSGFRALQLNRGAGLAGSNSFYAEYVFTVPSDGTWELWYGGTPPGPRDELYASYASPFSVTIDAQQTRPVAREDVSVVENYTPSFYWNRIGDTTLGAGRHQVRFEVTEKRRADARYVMYLDCFFLVRKQGGRRMLDAPVPIVFPKNMDDRSMDTPFPSVDDTLIRIRDNAGAVSPLLETARLYSMLGDYLNALKYLNRAAVLRPRDAQIGLLAAKNRIWKGDLSEGLKKYWEVLGLDPKQRELWLEAGKVAAWNGSYDESVGFFRDALAVFPGDLDLTVNLGLTLLWAGKGQDAESTFHAAQALAGTDPALLMDLARVYRVNGYPQRAVQALTAAVSAAPQSLEARLLLIDQLIALGRKVEADAAEKAIVETFVPSVRLTSLLDAFKEKESLKSEALAAEEDRLRQNPDNLVLRQTLAQSYFWNGMKDKAVNEYRHIIVNYQYSALAEAESRAPELAAALDRGYVLRDYFTRAPGMAEKALKGLAARASGLAQAGAARDAAQKALDAARQAQAKAKEGKDADAALASANAAEDKLVAAEEAVRKAGDEEAAAALEAQALVGQLDAMKLARTTSSDAAKELASKDAEAEASFTKQTASSRWTFDRAGILQEIARDTRDNDLARVVVAKISLADRQAPRAQSELAADSGSRASSSAAYTYGQSLLWGEKTREAFAAFSRLQDDPGSAKTPGGFKDLVALMKSLETPPVPAEGAPAPVAPVDQKQLSAELTALSKDAAAQQAALEKDLGTLHALYRRVVARAFYAAELQVAAIRNELGDYFLANEPPALDDAILQFRRVLAVDPADVDATFRLGKVYEWKRDWRSALDSYRVVSQADPSFENVATLYNRLAREHADGVTTMTSALADTHQMDWHTELTWSHAFDSTLGIVAAYKSDVLRLQSTTSGVPVNSSYQVHDVSVGVPVSLYLLNVSLTPVLGGLFHGNQQGGAAGVADYFESYSALPYARLDAGVGAWNTLFLGSTLRWGPQLETLDPARGTILFDASLEANLSTVLASVDVPVIRDTSLRTYGKVDLIHTGSLGYQNFLYTALQEVTVNVLKGGSPYTVVALTGNVTWQDSAVVEPFLYYAPNSVFLAGGSITASTWLAAGGGSVVGLSLRAYGGSYLESAFKPGTIHRFKAEGEANVSYTSGNAAWTLTVLGNGTWNLDTPSWDYWSLFLRLGCTLKLPELLAP